MTMNDHENGHVSDTAPLGPSPTPVHSKKPRCRRVFMWLCLIILLVLILVIIILFLTVFKIKQPKIELVSTTVEGVAPRVTFPVIKIELNITLNMTILVTNPNHASFKSEQGASQLLYNGEEVGNAVINPGIIPSKGSTTLVLSLTLQADRFADSAGVMALVQDVTDGELDLEVKTRIPGRAKILFIKKHVVVSSDCQFVIGFPDMKVKSQECKQHTKL